jgi:hypothetical protein
MDIWDANKLSLFIQFVVPGFISIKWYQLSYPGSSRSASDQIVDAVAYSCINYAIWSIPMHYVQDAVKSQGWSPCDVLFYILVMFISPVLLVELWKKVRKSPTFQKNAPHPTGKPWDFVFAQKKLYWMKIILKDGTILAGKYGLKSFASSAPEEEQIYIEECWILDEQGAFIRPKNKTAGVIVVSKEISHIELRALEL